MIERNQQEKRQLPIGPRVEAALTAAYRARRAVLLEGPTGIGKSEIVSQVARSLGVECCVLDLSLLEPPDLVGLPVIEDGRTRHAYPEILPTGGAGILMLEELNRAERYIQQPALQLLTARRLHQYELPAGWCAFAAINPEDDADYEVTPLDLAMRARFLSLGVCADRKSWLLWAERNELHTAVLEVARGHDRILEGVPPRSWKYASDILQALELSELGDEQLIRDLLGGYLPESWVEMVLATLFKSGADIGFDLYASLREDRDGAAARAVVRCYRENGQTDYLDEITARLGNVLESTELDALIARKQFSLAAFEELLAELPGDHRELIQEAFASNPASVRLVGLEPGDIVDHYPSSKVSNAVRVWLKDDLQRHRVWCLSTAVPSELRRRQVVPLKKDPRVRANLGRFISDLGPIASAPLVKELKGLGITPLAPRGPAHG